LIGAPFALVAQTPPALTMSSATSGTLLAGATLGAGAGAVFGTAATIIPCSETRAGPACVRIGATLSSVIGLAAGSAIGQLDRDEIETRAVGAGIGFAVAALGGFAAGTMVQRFDWRDALAVGALGGAVGSAPRGALIGAGAGTLLGLGLWTMISEFEVPELAATILGAMAIGALVDWSVSAVDTGRSAPPSFSIRIPTP
jgi:hypothetical protein